MLPRKDTGAVCAAFRHSRFEAAGSCCCGQPVRPVPFEEVAVACMQDCCSVKLSQCQCRAELPLTVKCLVSLDNLVSVDIIKYCSSRLCVEHMVHASCYVMLVPIVLVPLLQMAVSCFRVAVNSSQEFHCASQ